jgi:iron complex transport system substrate-binding protein
MRASFDPSFIREARGLLLSLVLALTLIGCAASSTSSGPISSTIASPSAATSDAPASDYPVTVTDDEGTDVEIAARPERIVSLTPATTEMLFAIGAGDRVIATTDADDYPPEAVPLPDVASFGSVDLEQIVALEADLVIAGGNEFTPSDAIRSLRDLDIPVVVIYASTVDAVAADVEVIGQAVGNASEAGELAEEMRAEIDALTAAVADLPRPRVFYEIDASTAIYGPADDSYLAEMIELAGGEPITTGSAISFEIPLELLVAADPEVIILGDAAFGTTPVQVAARPAWDEMTAVRDGAVRVADDKLITRPGPRLALGLRSLILAIHPEARLP